MEDQLAHRLVNEVLTLSRTHPQAPALDVLDLVFRPHRGADLDFTDAKLTHGDHTDPREAFGQLLAAAFDDAMAPVAWVNILAKAEDPDPLLDFWHGVIVGCKFAERYRLWGAGDVAPLATAGRTAAPEHAAQVPIEAGRISGATWPF